MKTGLLQSPGTALAVLLTGLAVFAPDLALAQTTTSPFLTGATALQSNILAWLTPIAIILVMVLGAMAMANRIDDKQRALEWLERAYQEHNPDLIELSREPSFASLRSDAKFRELMSRIGWHGVTA